MTKPNIIFVLLDGLRQDRIEQCSRLCSFIKENIYFSNMITVAPYTFASIPSIFSGLYPSKNGINGYYNMFRFRKERCRTLTEYLKERGYYTAGDAILDTSILPQGFDELSFHKNKHDFCKRHRQMIASIPKDRPFFLYLHYTGIHREMVKLVGKKTDDFNREYFSNKEENRKQYNRLLEECNQYVNELLEEMKQKNMLENSIVIFCSDHGTSNGERLGEKLYGVYAYEYTIRTFFAIKIPGFKAKTIASQCLTIDIMPTLLDILKIKPGKEYETLQGASLLPLINGEEKEDRPAFIETGGLYGPWPSPEKHNVFAIRWKNRKLIYNKTPATWEFYSLEKDPEEKKNQINTSNKQEQEEIGKYRRMLIENLRENNIPFKDKSREEKEKRTILDLPDDIKL